MSYSYGCAKKVPSKDDIRHAIGRLHRRRMIAKRKTTRGLVITVSDYDCYQNPMNYGCPNGRATDVPTEGQEGAHYKQECNKNEKKEEEGKPTNFSSKPAYLKTFDELARERADEAFERAKRRFLAYEQD
jgi:hypothetical protein